MSPLYTRTGDDGTTGLLGEGRVPKFHPRLEALGALDEATAALGLARSLCQAEQTEPLVIAIQRDLYKLMAEVAATPENAPRFRTLEPGRVQWLEAQADAIAALAPVPNEFILPGDSQAGAALSLALLQYLNRLSSLCFALELLENQAAGKATQRARKQPG